MSNYINTKNKNIIDFVTKQKKYNQITGLICAKCGQKNNIANYEFINNFNSYYVEKGFSTIEFTCYHCKEEYTLSAAINEFSPKIIEESLETAVKTLDNLIFKKFQINDINTWSKKLVDSRIKDFEDEPDLKYLHDEKLFELKQELKHISSETKEFLINCGMVTMKEFYKQILDEIKH